MKTIETKRLILRPFTLEDAEASYEMNTDSDVVKYLPWEHPESVDEVREMIQESIFADYEKYGYGRFAVTLKGDDTFIGFSGLKYTDEMKGVDLGYRFKKEHWGKGYATETSIPSLKFGFEDLDLAEIIAAAMPDNEASFNVMKKMGMTYRNDIEIEGDPFKLYFLLRETWRARNA